MALVVAGLAAPVYGQEVELAWKFTKGDKFYQEMKTKTVQDMKIMNQAVKQEQEQTFLFAWTVLEVSDAATVIEQKIESVVMSIKIGSNDVKYDSTAKDAADNPLASFFKPLVGASFKITLDPKMHVTKIEGREEFVSKLQAANPQMAGLLKVILSEEQMKQMSEPAFAVVKGKGEKVKPKDTWDRKSNLNMGPLGNYDATYTFTYAGPETKDKPDSKEKEKETLHKIDMETKLTYKAPDKDAAGGLPFKIESGNLKAEEAKGTILFNAEKGRVMETTMKVVLKGELKISVGDQAADVQLTQEQTTTTKTLDKNPNEPAKPMASAN